MGIKDWFSKEGRGGLRDPPGGRPKLPPKEPENKPNNQNDEPLSPLNLAKNQLMIAQYNDQVEELQYRSIKRKLDLEELAIKIEKAKQPAIIPTPLPSHSFDINNALKEIMSMLKDNKKDEGGGGMESMLPMLMMALGKGGLGNVPTNRGSAPIFEANTGESMENSQQSGEIIRTM